MAGTTNILVFNPSQANQETDAAYLTDATRTGGAGVDGIWPSNSANKTLYQISTVVAALAQMMANKNFSISDSNYAVLVAQLSNILTTTDLRSGVQALVWSPSITLNAATFAAFAVPLQGATTVSASGVVPGQVYVVMYAQDLAGGHTVTFGTGFGAAATQPASAGVSTQIFVADATSILRPAAPLFPTAPSITYGSDRFGTRFWSKDSSGKIEQWGFLNMTSGLAISDTFPINFTNLASVNVVVTSSSSTEYQVGVQINSISEFTCSTYASIPGVYWRAVGY